MNRLGLTGFRCQLQRSRRNTKTLRGVVYIQPRFDLVIGWLVDGNAVMPAQRGDALARPAISVARHQPVGEMRESGLAQHDQ